MEKVYEKSFFLTNANDFITYNDFHIYENECSIFDDPLLFLLRLLLSNFEQKSFAFNMFCILSFTDIIQITALWVYDQRG